MRTRAQAASTSSRKKAATHTLEREPTASEESTHVEVQSEPATEHDHKANGTNRSDAEIEVDSVLAKELSENGISPGLDHLSDCQAKS